MYLFAGLIAIALVDAWPQRSVERMAIDIGRRFCETSAAGTANTLAGSRSFPNVVFVGRHLANILHDNREYFAEDCQVELRYGDVGRQTWGGRRDGRADYFLVLSSHGENRMGIRLRWEFDWSFLSFPRMIRSCCGFNQNKFHIKIGPY